MNDSQRTHQAAIGLTFEEWNTWRGAARDAGFEHTSDWVRAVAAEAISRSGADSGGGDDAKRDLARELANIGAHLGALTDALAATPQDEAVAAALTGTDQVAAELSRLAQAVIDRW